MDCLVEWTGYETVSQRRIVTYNKHVSTTLTTRNPFSSRFSRVSSVFILEKEETPTPVFSELTAATRWGLSGLSILGLGLLLVDRLVLCRWGVVISIPRIPSSRDLRGGVLAGFFFSFSSGLSAPLPKPKSSSLLLSEALPPKASVRSRAISTAVLPQSTP